MTDSFADRARSLSGVAGIALGWRPGDFWTATPDELAAMLTAAGGHPPPAAPPDADTIALLKKAFPDG